MVHIPLSRRDARPRTAVDHVLNAERMRTRYALRSSSDANTPIERRAIIATMPLFDQVGLLPILFDIQGPTSLVIEQIDTSYYCTISIGTP